MTKSSLILSCLLFFVCTLQFVIGQNVTEINITQTYVPGWLNSSLTEYDKFIQDKYNYFMTTNGNKFWVGSMNLAWNQMKRKFLYNKNATFLNTNQLQQHMIDNLNSQIFTRDQLSQDAYYVYSGYGQQSVTKINFDIKEKFPARTLPDINYTLGDRDFISYAYLFKNFKFADPFEPLQTFTFKGNTVSGFQALNTKQKKQIYYKYYNNSNDFMIGITIKGQNDQILLWKTDMEGVNTDYKMDKVLKMFYMFYGLPSQPLARIDKFKMPVVNLNLKRSYKDLLKLRFADQQHKDYIISNMDENIKLSITRYGVEVQAQSIVQFFVTSSRYSKYFYLNNDFWVFLKEKNKLPYLFTLITNPTQTWQQ